MRDRDSLILENLYFKIIKEKDESFLNKWNKALEDSEELRVAVDLMRNIKAIHPNGEIYIVGGVPRDLLMGNEVDDVDLATNIPFEKLEGNFELRNISKSDSQPVYDIEWKGYHYDIAKFRTDSGDIGRQNNISTETDSFLKDTERRDLTINSFGLDENGNIVDHQNGLEDLKNKIVRAVGDPKKRFMEDATRILRVFRFAAKMGFDIDDQTKNAAKELKHFLSKPDMISSESIAKEFYKSAKSGKTLMLFLHKLQETGILHDILPEFTSMEGYTHNPKHHPEGGSSVLGHIYECLFVSPFDDPVINLAVLFHDFGKATTRGEKDGHSTYHGHEAAGVPVVENIFRRLKFNELTAEDKKNILQAVEKHMLVHNLDQLNIKTLSRLVLDPSWNVVKSVAFCDEAARGTPLFDEQSFKEKIKRAEEKVSSIGSDTEDLRKKIKQYVDGEKLMSWYPELQNQRPKLGKILRKTQDHVLELMNSNKQPNDDDVKRYVNSIYNESYKTTFKEYIFLKEAIGLKKALKKGFVRENGGAYKIDKINEIFKNKDRLIFDIDVSNSDVLNRSFPVLNKLLELFESKFPDYIIPDKQSYIQGFAYKKQDSERKRPIRIGKLLNSLEKTFENENILKSYNHDPLRASTKKKNFKVVISRHPYDIAGMSTDRSWTSCMNLGGKGINYPQSTEGINRRFVKNDIEYGTLVAYLVSDDDRHPNGKIAIKRPIARTLLKPYRNVNNNNDIAYSVERVYGTPNDSFVQFVRDWVDTNINTDVEGKKYVVTTGLYWDGKPYMNFNGNNRLDSDFANLFFSNLYRTDEKYYRNFEVQTMNNFYEQYSMNVEVKIEYSFDSSVPIEKYRYDSGDSIPKYIEDIMNSLELNKSVFFNRYRRYDVHLNTIETFPEDNNLLVFEFNFYLPNPWDEDYDEKYIDAQQTNEYHEERFEELMRESKFEDFNYISSYKKIRNILMTADIQEEKENSLARLVKAFENSVNMLDREEKGFRRKRELFLKFKNNEYKNAIEYFKSLGNIFLLNINDLNNLIDGEQFKKHIANIEEYKKQHAFLIKQLSYYKPNGGYTLINTDKEWRKLEFKFLETSKEDIKMELDNLEAKMMPITYYFRVLGELRNDSNSAAVYENIRDNLESIRNTLGYY